MCMYGWAPAYMSCVPAWTHKSTAFCKHWPSSRIQCEFLCMVQELTGPDSNQIAGWASLTQTETWYLCPTFLWWKRPWIKGRELLSSPLPPPVGLADTEEIHSRSHRRCLSNICTRPEATNKRGSGRDAGKWTHDALRSLSPLNQGELLPLL